MINFVGQIYKKPKTVSSAPQCKDYLGHGVGIVNYDLSGKAMRESIDSKLYQLY